MRKWEWGSGIWRGKVIIACMNGGVGYASWILLVNISEPLRGQRIVFIKVKKKSKIGGEMLQLSSILTESMLFF